MQITDIFRIVSVAEIKSDKRNARKHSDEQIMELGALSGSLASSTCFYRQRQVNHCGTRAAHCCGCGRHDRGAVHLRRASARNTTKSLHACWQPSQRARNVKLVILHPLDNLRLLTPKGVHFYQY